MSSSAHLHAKFFIQLPLILQLSPILPLGIEGRLTSEARALKQVEPRPGTGLHTGLTKRLCKSLLDNQISYFSSQIINAATSAGDTPEIRAACPKFKGLTAFSFSLASSRKP